MELMERRVQCTEEQEQGSSQVSPLPSTSQSQPGSSTVSNSNATQINADQSVVSSIDFLRANESIQCEVEKHLAELRTLNETASKDRIKTQCEGPGDIFVQKSVDWPQNFILRGSQKTSPTYDDLSIIQWASEFMPCIQEEKS